MEITLVESLLFQAKNIVQKNDIVRRERLSRGELFNTFTIIGLWSEEVRLHSAFLAELLNPQGSHGLQDEMLKSFCHIAGFSEFPVKGATVEVEKPVGNITQDYSEGGKIDIFIQSKDKNYVIVIENKVYAGDQKNQLKRYNNYIEKMPGLDKAHYRLFYLTRLGFEPSDFSTGIENKEESYWHEISYSEIIKNWLQECIGIAAQKPLVRESIVQYLDLVKQLTNQTLEEAMSNEIVDILIKDNNLEIAEELQGQIYNAKQKSFTDKIFPEIEKLAKKNNLEVKKSENNIGDKESGFWFYKTNWDNMCISFWFEAKYFNNFIYGVTCEDGGKEWNKGILAVIKKIGNNQKGTEWWPWWNWFADGFKTEYFTNPQKFIKEIEKCISFLLPQLEKILESC